MIDPDRHEFLEIGLSRRRHVERLDTPVGLGFAPFDEALVFQPVDDGDKIRPLNAERLGHFALLCALIVGEQKQDRKSVGRSPFEEKASLKC